MISITIIIVNFIVFYSRKFLLRKFIIKGKLIYYMLSFIQMLLGLVVISTLAHFEVDLLVFNKALMIISIFYFLFSTPKLHVDENGKYFLNTKYR